MVKDHSDSEKGNPLLPHRLLFLINSKGLLYAPSHRQDSTYHSLCYTSRGALAETINSLVILLGHAWIRFHSLNKNLILSIILLKILIYYSVYIQVDPQSYFSFQPVLHDWCNKDHGMCYPVCGMVHIN